MDVNYFEHIADSHRRKAADIEKTDAERLHWESEAERFEGLAWMARTRPAEARAAYRPTRAYQPAES